MSLLAILAVIPFIIGYFLLKRTVVAIRFDDIAKLKNTESWDQYLREQNDELKKELEPMGGTVDTIDDPRSPKLIKQVAFKVDCECDEKAFHEFQKFATEVFGVEKERIGIHWKGSFKIIIDCENPNNVQGIDGLKCQNAEFFYDTLKHLDPNLLTLTIDGRKVQVEQFSPVFVESHNKSLRDIIDRSDRLKKEENKNDDIAYYQTEKNVELFVPRTRGGGKQLDCIPYWRKANEQSSKPSILKANRNIFFVLATDTKLVARFEADFDRFEEDKVKETRPWYSCFGNKQGNEDYIIFKRREGVSLATGQFNNDHVDVGPAGEGEEKEEF